MDRLFTCIAFEYRQYHFSTLYQPAIQVNFITNHLPNAPALYLDQHLRFELCRTLVMIFIILTGVSLLLRREIQYQALDSQHGRLHSSFCSHPP